jgi:hypothetical protein
MYTARRKIQKDKGVEPNEFEETVAQVSRLPVPKITSSPASVSGTAQRLDSSGLDVPVVFYVLVGFL